MCSGHMGKYVCAQLYKWGEEEVESQVDMYTCTDAYTHSYQGLGPEAG